VLSEVIINLNHLHPKQQQVLKESSRFNTLCCGRRWGKTTLSEDLIICPDYDYNGALNGFPVAYFAPTYKMLMEVWREMNVTLYGIIKNKSETEKRIELFGGGIIDFWSLEDPNSIRGRYYKRAVIDESAIARNLKEAWLRVIRPTLTDLQGDAWFLSTPKGKSNYFYELFLQPEKFSDWRSWQMPTSSNPFIPPEEIKQAEQQLDPLTFAQEYLASFITEELDAFAYCYDPLKHIGKTELSPSHEICLSFDFNRNPITCGVFQHYNNAIYGIEQIKLPNSDIYKLCDYIKAKYGRYMILVTGDATGQNSTALVKDNLNYYMVIKTQLSLGAGQMKVDTVNPHVEDNRVLVNSVLHHIPVSLDPDMCKALIFDLEHARMLPNGSLDKSDRNDPTKQLDALDCFRYYLNTFFKWVLRQ
jgi:hypothetical protein